MGCAVGTLATESRVVIEASDSGGCEMPTHLLIPGGKRCVPEQLRPNFTLMEWLHIVSQLERTVCRGGGCFGPDPLVGPGQALAASLNDSYASTRGVRFSLMGHRAAGPSSGAKQRRKERRKKKLAARVAVGCSNLFCSSHILRRRQRGRTRRGGGRRRRPCIPPPWRPPRRRPLPVRAPAPARGARRLSACA